MAGSPLSYFLNDAVNAVENYGAAGDGFTDCTTALQNALATGQNVYLPAGTYMTRQPLTLNSGQALIGAGMNLTVIKQANTAADTLTMTDQRYITVRDLALSGPGTGTGRGIAFNFSTSALASLVLENLRVYGFGGRGVYLNTPITSVLRNIRVENCGSDYFYLNGGTSVTLDSCYADTSTVGAVNGIVLNAMSYCTLNSCAADNIVGNGSGGGSAYLVSGSSTNITFNACGNESSAIGFKITGSSRDITLSACEVYQENTFAFLVTSTSTNVTLISCREQSPQGSPTASISVGSGCSAVVINPDIVTAASYSTGTAYVITSTGGTAH